MSKSREPLLDINTEPVKRHHIKIDGVAYELLAPAEMMSVHVNTFEFLGRALKQAQDKSLGEETIEPLLRRTLQLSVVGLPDEIIDKLPIQHKLSIAEVFVSTLLAERIKRTAALVPAVLNDDDKGERPAITIDAELRALFDRIDKATAKRAGEDG